MQEGVDPQEWLGKQQPTWSFMQVYQRLSPLEISGVGTILSSLPSAFPSLLILSRGAETR
jgi:hypothetical protein